MTARYVPFDRTLDLRNQFLLQFEVGWRNIPSVQTAHSGSYGVWMRIAFRCMPSLSSVISHLDTMGFSVSSYNDYVIHGYFMRRLPYTSVTNVARFPNSFRPAKQSMPSLRSAAGGKLLLCTKSTTCFTNPAKPKICCGRGSLATSPFNLLRARCFVGCLFRSTSVKVNYRTSVGCYTLSKIGCSFVCSVQDTCSEKKKEFGNPWTVFPRIGVRGLVESLFLSILVPCYLRTLHQGYLTGGKRSLTFLPLCPLNFQTD
jgi:hypothetical protein